MKGKLKKVLCVLATLTMFVGLIGCGNTSNNKDTSKSSSKQESSENDKTKKEDKQVELSYWNIFVGADSYAGSMEKLMKEFQQQYPNIKITEEKIPHDQYKTKLKTQAAAGQLPDMFLIWPNTMTKEFASAGLITDITDFIDSEKEWSDGFVEGCYNDYTVDGKVYSVPLGITITSVVYYNRALFDKYNLQYPKTYEELKNVVKVFKENDIIPIALGNKGKWPAQSCIFSTFADRQTGTDWFKNIPTGESKFTDEQFIGALRKFKELVEIGAFNEDLNTIDDVQARDYLYNEKAAMTINGSWMLGDVIEKASDGLKKNIELGVLPAIKGGKGNENTVSGVTGTGVVINSKVSEEKKKAAQEFIKFITDKHAQETYAYDSLSIAYKVQLDESKIDPLFGKLLKLIEDHPLVPVYDAVLSLEQTDSINNGLQHLTVDGNPEEIAEELQRISE
jgi:raffinose/stachyose/melibiose transport system substrate-binding protein